MAEGEVETEGAGMLDADGFTERNGADSRIEMRFDVAGQHDIRDPEPGQHRREFGVVQQMQRQSFEIALAPRWPAGRISGGDREAAGLQRARAMRGGGDRLAQVTAPDHAGRLGSIAAIGQGGDRDIGTAEIGRRQIHPAGRLVRKNDMEARHSHRTELSALEGGDRQRRDVQSAIRRRQLHTRQLGRIDLDLRQPGQIPFQHIDRHLDRLGLRGGDRDPGVVVAVGERYVADFQMTEADNIGKVRIGAGQAQMADGRLAAGGARIVEHDIGGIDRVGQTTRSP